MSEAIDEKRITIPQTIGILIAVIIVVSAIGYFVGKLFFWNQYDSASVYERQVEALENFAEKNPKSRNAKVMLFDKYFGLGEYDKARKILTDLKKDLSKHPDIMYRDALMLKQDGEGKKALEEIKKVVESKPFFTSARVLYAQLLADNKQYDKAIDEMKMVLKIMPAAADLYLEQAKFYLAKGDKKNALASVDHALKMVPNYQEALEFKKQIK